MERRLRLPQPPSEDLKDLVLSPGWKLFLAQHIRPLVDRYRGKLLGTEDLEPVDRLAMIRTLKELSNRLQGPYVDGGVEVPQHLQNWLS